MRERLPNRRHSENSQFIYQGVQVDLQCGYYTDGRLGEVFMSTRRLGTVIDTLCVDTAVLISVALQHGATVEDLQKSAVAGSPSQAEGIVMVLCEHLFEMKLDIKLDL